MEEYIISSLESLRNCPFFITILEHEPRVRTDGVVDKITSLRDKIIIIKEKYSATTTTKHTTTKDEVAAVKKLLNVISNLKGKYRDDENSLQSVPEESLDSIVSVPPSLPSLPSPSQPPSPTIPQQQLEFRKVEYKGEPCMVDPFQNYYTMDYKLKEKEIEQRKKQYAKKQKKV
jgi:hypothetical protein